jgi:hypothetical protein
MTDLNYQTFVRKPFTVEAVEVTEDNIAELAPSIGALVRPEDGSPFIEVDPKKVPHVSRVFPGFFLTKMGKRTHCYSPKSFRSQFADADEHNLQWVAYLNGDPMGKEADQGG